MTRYNDRNKYRPDAESPIVVDDSWYGESRPPYICDTCHKTLSKLQDRSGLNQSYYCSTCQIEYDPEAELRSKSKISVSEGPTDNPVVSYPPEPSLLSKKKTEIKGGLKALQQRGVKVTSYTEGKG